MCFLKKKHVDFTNVYLSNFIFLCVLYCLSGSVLMCSVRDFCSTSGLCVSVSTQTSLSIFEESQGLTSEVDENGRCPNGVCNASASLTILSASPSDAGTYGCKASINLDLPAAIDAVLPVPFNVTVIESK